MSRETKRFLIKFTAVIVAVVAILYIALSVYRKSWNPVKWFDTPQTNIETENQTQNTQSGLVSPEEVEMNGIKIAAATISPSLYDTYAVPMAAETALTLTITPTPEDADLTGAKFTIAFKNASSAWATGKSVATYVTLSQSTVKQATVSCLKAFGEPIVITYTVKGENGANKTATYQLDYRARIVSYNFTDTPFTAQEFEEDYSQVYVDFILSDYTVKETFTVQSVKFDLTAQFRTALIKAQLNPGTYNQNSLDKTLKDENSKLRYSPFLPDISSVLLPTEICKTQAFRSACESGKEFEFSVTITDGYTTETYSHEFDIDISEFPKAAQSVQFSGGSQHTF